MTNAVDALRRLYQRAAEADYIGEPVSQRAHALQAAWLARRDGAPDETLLAALLHDVGHLAAAPDAPRMGAYGARGHEVVGADWLATLGFGAAVHEPVRGHVAAKRYRVVVEPDYASRLSEASRVTLGHQGGPMSEAERRAFEASPWFEACLRLRAWDEAAKRADLEVPDFESYVPLIEAHLRAEARSGRPGVPTVGGDPCDAT